VECKNQEIGSIIRLYQVNAMSKKKKRKKKNMQKFYIQGGGKNRIMGCLEFQI
jgi:hypothetical protein